MATSRFYCRDIFSLSDQEIVKLVDFILDNKNLDRLAGYFHDERPMITTKNTYRKIEVYSAFYDWAYIVKVTYVLEGLDREVTTGFILGMEGGPGDEHFYSRDIYIQSVKGFFSSMEGQIWEKGVADSFEIEVDFSIYQIYLGKFHDFMNNTLKIRSDQLEESKYEWNPRLKDMFKANSVNKYLVAETTAKELT